MLNHNRKTKIVCTIGPATASAEMMKRLIKAGMDVARLNFSHGDESFHRQTIRTLRQLAQEIGRPIGILQDLAGPKIRLGDLSPPEQHLKRGQRAVLTSKEGEGGTLPVRYPYLIQDVEIGDRILLADGLVELRAAAKEDDRIVCEVVAGGDIQSRKGVNFPNANLRVPAVTDKDKADLEIGLEERVDFIALSFVRQAEDLEPVLERIKGLPVP
ncbi:MAG: pyruvate kinase, partial [Deltaproteobacteria bacterium]|nr:pyruvate kinase [Deltaproteobacteria bacterium]